MILDTDDVRVFYDEDSEIVAVYLRGKFLCSDERMDVLLELLTQLGIALEYSDAFLCGSTEGYAADTLTEIEEWQSGAGDRVRRADELERQADEFRREAARLRGN